MTLKNKKVCIYLCQWIKNPHDKIALCVCDKQSFLFWFNSSAAFHGHGQLAIAAGEHPAITKGCYLDLSGIKGISSSEATAARDRGPISDALKARVLAALANPIATLPEAHRNLALQNLS
ncbi:MAG TPA: hypothetical protein VGV41_05320 [Pseudolabrys sp.]|uniref:hypothetical protein n=1 Tax=Pseudolabrys sp. TaxID=1960880 RepID=UPI002DDD9CCD|nr:hypothetical protein [Pseudolabrys sp.]HEV2628045.1 hypothetical protein [Pseudolabrys sp.]